MTIEQRLAKLAQDCYERLGSYAKLGDLLGVTRQQAHRICNGQSEPTGSHVVRMQDLLRKVAIVLLAWSLVSAPQDSQATARSAAKDSGVSRSRLPLLQPGFRTPQDLRSTWPPEEMAW